MNRHRSHIWLPPPSKRISVVSVLQLYVQLRDLRVRSWFGVMEHLATDVLPGIYFINRYVRSVFPQERRIVSFKSLAVPILSIGNQEHPVISNIPLNIVVRMNVHVIERAVPPLTRRFRKTGPMRYFRSYPCSDLQADASFIQSEDAIYHRSPNHRCSYNVERAES